MYVRRHEGLGLNRIHSVSYKNTISKANRKSRKGLGL